MRGKCGLWMDAFQGRNLRQIFGIYFLGGIFAGLTLREVSKERVRMASETTDCGRESAALEEVCEAGFGAEGIPLGVDGEEDQVDVVGVEGAVEPVQGETGVAQAGVDEGHGVRWDEALTGDGFEGLEDLQCFAGAAGFCEDVAAQRQCLGVAGAEPTSFVERVEG